MSPKNNNSFTQSNSKVKERRQTRQKSKQRLQFIQIGAGIIAVLAVIFMIYSFNSSTSNVDIEGLQTFPNQQQGHISDPVTYSESPPVGGQHNPAWQNCGVYSQTIANENGVHTLEHGAVWITYQPNLPADQIEKLQTLTRQGGYRLLTPYTDLTSPIVISAWGYQLALENADDPRLAQFIEAYELSPSAPEPGASCSGAIGQPE